MLVRLIRGKSCRRSQHVGQDFPRGLLAGAKAAFAVMEATGKLHRLAHRMLSQAGYVVTAVNPSRPRKFAKAIGQFAKTDKIDARILALSGACLSPSATAVPAKKAAELQEIILARQAAKADETALKNRHGAAESKVLQRLLKRQLTALASARRQTWMRPPRRLSRPIPS